MKPYLTAFASLILMIAAPSHAAELRIGMIGLDTSHAIAFTQLLNDPKNKQFIPGIDMTDSWTLTNGGKQLQISRLLLIRGQQVEQAYIYEKQ